MLDTENHARRVEPKGVQESGNPEEDESRREEEDIVWEGR